MTSPSDPSPASIEFDRLYTMAMSGQPEAASNARDALTKVSQSLQQISETLKAPLGQLGESWQGQAADAAKAGIGQHVQWAETTSQQLGTMATDADNYFNSATSVRSQMQELQAKMLALQAAASAGGPAGAPNAAAAEAAEVEVVQQAKECFQQHAGVCTSSAPKVAATAPPSAGTGGKVTPAEETTEGPGKSPDKNAGSTTESEAGALGAGTGGKTSSAGAVDGPEAAGDGGLGEGVGATGSPSEYGSGAGGVLGTTGAGYQPVGRTRGSAYAMDHGSSDDGLSGGYDEAGHGGGLLSDGVVPAGGVLGAGGGNTYRPAKPKTRTQGATPDQPSHADTALAGRPGEHDHQDQQGGLPGGGMMSPGMMGGGAAAATGGRQGQTHESPDYLVDEDELFNNDDWVAPPVIGR